MTQLYSSQISIGIVILISFYICLQANMINYSILNLFSFHHSLTQRCQLFCINLSLWISCRPLTIFFIYSLRDPILPAFLSAVLAFHTFHYFAYTHFLISYDFEFSVTT